MTKDREKFFSVEEEVALHPELASKETPSEETSQARDVSGDY